MKRVAIIGGGISGLAAAFTLEQGRQGGISLEYAVYESSSRLGGVLVTDRADGCLVEAGPDSFISEKPWALQLSERIGLTPRLVRTRDENRRTYVVHNGKLHSLPDGFLLLAPTQFLPLVTTRLFTWPGKIRMALASPRPEATVLTAGHGQG